MGNGRRLKEHDPETKVVAAEPMQGELVSGLRSLDDGFIPPIIDLSVLDRKIMVSNENSIRWTQWLLHEEGLFAGVSSGAIAYVARRIAAEIDGRPAVAVVADPVRNEVFSATAGGGAHCNGRTLHCSDKADLATESRAAVAGGVTSFMDMPNVSPPI